MKKYLKRIASAALALCMAVGIGTVAASAADGVPHYYDDYMYSAKLTITPDEPLYSFTTALFDTDVVINVNKSADDPLGYSVSATTYVVDVIPSNSTKNPITDLVMLYDGIEHHNRIANFDHTERTFDVTSKPYGINAGDYLMAGPLSFAGFGSAQVKALEQGVKAYYLFSDGTRVDCTFRLSDFQLVWDHGKAPAAKPDETSEQALNLTAEVAAPAPTYSVSIPETVAMGVLSAETDNVTEYTVDVTAENLGTGRIVVSAPETGVLSSAEHTLALANRFGTQETSVSTVLSGAFTVSAADVAAAAAGNYTGAVSFTVSYFAGK